MTSTSAMEDVRDALASQIARLAKDASPSETKTLAEAYSLIAHGPQGGSYQSDQRGTTDYHQTHHQGEARPSVGFAVSSQQALK